MFIEIFTQDKEKLAGGNAARILALDDYFMVEVEHTVKDPESGKSVVKTVSTLFVGDLNWSYRINVISCG